MIDGMRHFTTRQTTGRWKGAAVGVHRQIEAFSHGSSGDSNLALHELGTAGTIRSS